MDHWGGPGHIYISHPVMWALPNALFGISIDLLSNSMTFSPRQIGTNPILSLPGFLPYFWLWVEYNFTTQQAKLKVIKILDSENSPNKNQCMQIDVIYLISDDDKRIPLVFDTPFIINEGEKVNFQSVTE